MSLLFSFVTYSKATPIFPTSNPWISQIRISRQNLSDQIFLDDLTKLALMLLLIALGVMKIH